MPVKDLAARVQELHDVMDSCHERMKSLVHDYHVNVLQTAAVIAAAKINEEKAEIEKKRESLRKQIEKEKERGHETVDKVYITAEESIDALISDQQKELREAMERQHKVKIAKMKTETDEKMVQEFAGVKRKYSVLEESKEYGEEEELSNIDNDSEDFKCADCGRLSPNMFMCEQCQTATYCDELCQARDWNKHQENCTEAMEAN